MSELPALKYLCVRRPRVMAQLPLAISFASRWFKAATSCAPRISTTPHLSFAPLSIFSTTNSFHFGVDEKKFSKRHAKKEKYYQHYNLWIFQIICSNPAIIPRNRISNRLFISYNRLSTRVKITILILLNQSEYLQMRIMKDFWIIV